MYCLQIIEKLSVNAPSPEVKLKVLKEISREHNLEWDSSNIEAELRKKHEDLLVFAIMLSLFCLMKLSPQNLFFFLRTFIKVSCYP